MGSVNHVLEEQDDRIDELEQVIKNILDWIEGSVLSKEETSDEEEVDHFTNTLLPECIAALPNWQTWRPYREIMEEHCEQ